MLMPGKSSVKEQLEIVDIFFLGELDVVYMDRGAHFSSCGECDDRFGPVSFYSQFLKLVLYCS
jgi:hypothetical protein